MIRPMTTIMSIGLAGMRAAETRAEIRAHNIVQASVHDARQFTPVQTTQAAMPVVRAQSLPRDATGQPFQNLAEDIVDLKIAMHSYRASAAIVRTGSEMSKTLMDALI